MSLALSLVISSVSERAIVIDCTASPHFNFPWTVTATFRSRVCLPTPASGQSVLSDSSTNHQGNNKSLASSHLPLRSLIHNITLKINNAC